MTQAPASSQIETGLDATVRVLGEVFAKFDPFRFRAWAELGLTTAQLRVIFHMRESPGVTAGELACRLSVTPPTISGIVDRLVKLGLVRRADDESDRRLVRNFLSPAGDAAASRLEKGSDYYTRRILMEMKPEEIQMMLTGLQSFVSASKRVQEAEPNLALSAMP